METQGDGGRGSGPVPSGAEAGAAGRRKASGVRAPIALIAIGAAIFWAWRAWWDRSHPLLAAARGLGAGDASRRAETVHEVATLGVGRGGDPIRLLIPALKDEAPGVRVAAAEALAMLGSNAANLGVDPEDVGAAAGALGQRMRDPDARVRVAVTTALGMIGASTVVHRGLGLDPGGAGAVGSAGVDVDAVGRALVAALGEPDAAVRRAAITGLGALAVPGSGGPPPELIRELEDESAVNRAAAADALSTYRSGLDPAIPPMLRHLQDPEPRVCQACALALGGIRPSAVSPAVAPALIAALRTPDREARRNLVGLVARLEADPRAVVPALIAVLREPIGSDARAIEPSGGPYETYEGPAHSAARALGTVAPGRPQAGEAMAALTEVVRSGPPQRRGSAAEALGAFGPAAAPAVPALIGLLKETAASQVPTRAGGAAARALGKIAPGTPAADAALAALAAALRDPWPPTREAALAALPAFGPKSATALPAIRELKDKDPDRGVRKAAGAVLGKIKP